VSETPTLGRIYAKRDEIRRAAAEIIEQEVPGL